ncbi:MAG: amidase [Acidobacteriia bacterium]|nr:amidase [Terriglobia bacterium]
MTRRAFVGSGLLGGTLAIAEPFLPSLEFAEITTEKSAFASFELEEATLRGLQEGMQSGKYTARKIVEAYLSRIEALNQKGPRLSQVLEINPEALATADALDAERKAKGARGPLHGIPILLKDNIGTTDRMTTTAGSLALAGSVPPRDAFVAARLRHAGAILLGKTNMSEWANFRSTHSSSGWSGRGGQCRNPYALDRTPSGSSSGSAGAVAANLCAAAVGTETDGSVVSPSSACSIVGIKPTVGLISRSGIIPIAHSQDTAGPMARTVTDAAILLGAMTGVDMLDEATDESSGKALNDYTRFLVPDGLRGARLGIARAKFFDYNGPTVRLIESAIDLMKHQGAVIVDPADIATAGQFDDSEFEVLLYEFKADLNKYLAGLGPNAPVRTLKNIIEFNERTSAKEMPFFGQEILLMAEKKGTLESEDYRKALTKDLEFAREKGIDATLDKHKLDAIVAPTAGPPPFIDLVNGDASFGSSSTPAAVAGYPHITVPAGYVFGLPVGISFFGRPYSEPVLIKLAYSFEQATKHRRPPQFRPSADLPK